MASDEHAPRARPALPRPCAACAESLSEAAWLGLPLAHTITPATILQHVSTWPADALVEVRSCRSCGRSIARKVRLRAEV